MHICVTCGAISTPCCDNEKYVPVEQFKAHLMLKEAEKDLETIERFLRKLPLDECNHKLGKELDKERERNQKRVRACEGMIK